MFPKTKSIFTSLVLACLFLCFSTMVQADEVELTMAQVGETLSAVESYDYGQSREALVKFSALVRAASNQNKLLPEIEQAMLGLLKSDAPFAAKQFICKELSLIGTSASIKTLSGLLKEEKTADIALYALERIPGEEVNKALRKAAGKTKGRIKVGILNTLGQRRDEEALKLFKKSINDKNPMVAEAAIAASGKLASMQAADMLTKQLEMAEANQKIHILDALLNTADQLRTDDTQLANSLYQGLYEDKQPITVRTAALRGLVVTLGDDAALMIKQAVQDEQPAIRSTAIALIRELPKTADLTDVVDSMPELEPGLEVQLLAALMDRGAGKSVDAVRRSLKSEDDAVRIAALKALAVLGTADDVLTIADQTANATGDVKEAAREALYRLNAPRVDATILAEIETADVNVKRELVRSVGRRPIPTATETMLTTAKDEDRRVRTESLRVLGTIAEPESLPALIDLLLAAEASAEVREAQKTVSLVSQKIDDAAAQSDAVLAVLPDLKDPKKAGSLLEVLGNIGSPKSLPVLRKALSSKKSEMKLSAIRALSDWPNGEPMADLLPLAQKAKDETQRILALRGYIGLVEKSDLDEAGKVGAYQTAFDLSEQITEKRQVLSGLSNIASGESLSMLGAQLNNPELMGEAEAGILKLRWALMGSHPEELKIQLKKIVTQTEDGRVRAQAKEILDRME